MNSSTSETITNGRFDRGTKWIEIQKNTFTNWVNEQLRVSQRSVKDIGTDFCDGVNLVALVESLQLKKIGKVYAKPTTRIQMIQNVAIACKAITEDNIKLVNIGRCVLYMCTLFTILYKVGIRCLKESFIENVTPHDT
jgi:hypothetical protein